MLTLYFMSDSNTQDRGFTMIITRFHKGIYKSDMKFSKTTIGKKGRTICIIIPDFNFSF